ncbi:hypothetical protein ACTFIZ_009704 [Dictyostelium cf. discoideum]
MTIIASIITISNPKQSTTGSVSTANAAFKFGSNSISCGGSSGSGSGSSSGSGLLGGVLGGSKGLLGLLGGLGGSGGSPNVGISVGGMGPQSGSMMGPCPCGYLLIMDKDYSKTIKIHYIDIRSIKSKPKSKYRI